MTDARVPRLAHDEAVAAAAAAGLPAYLADLDVFRVLLRHGPLAARLQELLMLLLFAGELDPRLRELVIMRIGWRTGSVYEWTQHWRIAWSLGVAGEDLLAVRSPEGWSRLDPPARAVLSATDDVLRDGVIGEPTWAELSVHVPSERARLQLVAAIGAWLMLSTMLRSLDVPVEDGVQPWPPDGLAPVGSGGR